MVGMSSNSLQMSGRTYRGSNFVQEARDVANTKDAATRPNMTLVSISISFHRRSRALRQTPFLVLVSALP